MGNSRLGDIVIVTPFYASTDSRAQRLAKAVEGVNRSACIYGRQESSHSNGGAIGARFNNYVRAWNVIVKTRGVLIAVNAEFVLIAAIARFFGLSKPSLLVGDIYDHHGYIFHGFFSWVFHWVERAAILAADVAILPIKERLDQYRPALPSHVQRKILYMSNLGFERFVASKRLGGIENAVRYVGGTEERRTVIVFAGTLDVGRGLESLALAGVKFYSDLDVRIYGTGPLAKSFELNPLLAKCYYGPFIASQLEEIYRAADIISAFYELTVKNHKFCDPNKLREVFEHGKPMITNNMTPLSANVRDLGVGTVIDEVTPEGIHDAAKHMASHLELFATAITEKLGQFNEKVSSNADSLNVLKGMICPHRSDL